MQCGTVTFFACITVHPYEQACKLAELSIKFSQADSSSVNDVTIVIGLISMRISLIY